MIPNHFTKIPPASHHSCEVEHPSYTDLEIEAQLSQVAVQYISAELEEDCKD